MDQFKMPSTQYTLVLSADTDMHKMCYAFCFMRGGKQLTFFFPIVLNELETCKHHDFDF